MSDLGIKIKTLRKLQKMTQQFLAEKSQLSVMSIRRYESGERKPDPEHLEKISRALSSTSFEQKTLYTDFLRLAGYIEDGTKESPFSNGEMTLPIILFEQKINDESSNEITTYDRDLNEYRLEDIFNQVSRPITINGFEIEHDEAIHIFKMIKALIPILEEKRKLN